MMDRDSSAAGRMPVWLSGESVGGEVIGGGLCLVSSGRSRRTPWLWLHLKA